MAERSREESCTHGGGFGGLQLQVLAEIGAGRGEASQNLGKPGVWVRKRTDLNPERILLLGLGIEEA